MGFTSEDQKIKFLSTKKMSLSLFIGFVAKYRSQNISAKKDALNVWLKRKGTILEAQRRFQDALIYFDEPEAIEAFHKLSRIRNQLSKIMFGAPAKKSPEAYKRKISDLEKQKEKLESKLSRLSHAFALKQKIVKADCEKIVTSLPKDTALIEIAKLEIFNFMAKGKEKKRLPAFYIAFILYAGNFDKVGMINLGGADKIDRKVVEFRQQISKMGKSAMKLSKEIYNLIFKPIKKELGKIKEIFISPDGNLNLIPFEVLIGPDGKYLIEDYTFNYLSAGRDVLGFGKIMDKGKKALIIGDPDFDMSADEKDSTLKKLALTEGKHQVTAMRSSDMEEFHFERLPATLQEVKEIHVLLKEDQAELYTGKEALEEVLKQSETPSILHLATHAFFLRDQDLGSIQVDLSERGYSAFSFPTKKNGKRIRTENPMLRSGFALAGANRSLTIPDEQFDDGIVTAEDVLGLRLRGTDMVVLSACDTGLGEIQTGEGVFGLRRAFAWAGAKSVIMSLWAVPDKETRELMVEFYKNIIKRKMNRCQALRQATLKEMKIVKKRYGHANPYFWGGFVMVGDPG